MTVGRERRRHRERGEDLGEVVARGVVEIIGDLRQGVDQGLIVGVFGVENAERIGLGAALVVFAELVLDRNEGFAEGGDVAGAVGGGAYGVEFEPPAIDAQLVEQGREHFEDFGVADGTLGSG